MPKKKSRANYIIHLAIAVFFMFVFGYICPTWADVTRQGVQAIGIFIGGIWLISTGYGLAVPSLMIMFAMILTGYTTGTEVIQSTLGSTTVWQLIVIFVVLFALTETGADRVLARFMISRRSLNHKPILFSIVFLLALTTMGALASALGSFLFGVSMVNAIAETVGYDNKSQWKKTMILGVVITSSVGGGILPFKGMALMIYNLFLEGIVEAGLQVDQVSYMVAGIVCGILIPILFGLAMKPLFRVDFSKLNDVDVAQICAEGGTKFSKRQAAAMILFLVGFVYSIVMIWLPESMPGYTIINNIGQGFWFVFVLIIMALIKIDGEPIINVDRSMGKAVNWGIVLAVCAFTAIGGMISDTELGIRTWLGGILENLFGNMPFILFVVILVVITLVCTNVFSNTATAVVIGTIIGPIIIGYGVNDGINVSAVIPALVMTALCAFMTMAAGGSAPLFLGDDSMKDDPKWIWKYGPIAGAIVIISISLGCCACAYIL